MDRAREFAVKSADGVAVQAEILAKEFAKEPALAFVSVIREAGKPIGAADIKNALIAAGVPKAKADARWTNRQPLLKVHPRIRVQGGKYVWADPIPAAQALSWLVESPKLSKVPKTLPAWLRGALGEAAQAGLGGDDGRDRAYRESQERQWQIDAVRGVAELAMDLEELIHNGAEPEDVLDRVRERASLMSLVPIGQAGEDTTFDPAQHTPSSGSLEPASAVYVVRPGYVWSGPKENVLIERAVVATA